MRRKQKTAQAGCSCEDKLEAESTMKAPSIAHTENAGEERAQTLLECIAHQSEHGRGVQTGSQKRRCVRHRRNDSPSDVWTPEGALSRTYPKPL